MATSNWGNTITSFTTEGYASATYDRNTGWYTMSYDVQEKEWDDEENC